MGDASDGHNPMVVINNVHDAIIADPQSPEIFVSTQFFAPQWSWLGRQTLNPRYQTCKEIVTEILQFFTGRRLDEQSVFTHASGRAL